MTKGSALTLCWVGVLAIAANCAQGSSDTDPDAGGPSGADAGRESLEASALALDEAGPKPAGDAAGGGPSPESDSGGPDDADAGGTEDAGQDTGAPVHDAGVDSGKGSVVPTTCAQADQGYGCCVGNDVYYCNTSNMVVETKCTGGKVCGWEASKTYYNCVASPGGAAPGTMYPIACK